MEMVSILTKLDVHDATREREQFNQWVFVPNSLGGLRDLEQYQMFLHGYLGRRSSAR